MFISTIFIRLSLHLGTSPKNYSQNTANVLSAKPHNTTIKIVVVKFFASFFLFLINKTQIEHNDLSSSLLFFHFCSKKLPKTKTKTTTKKQQTTHIIHIWKRKKKGKFKLEKILFFFFRKQLKKQQQTCYDQQLKKRAGNRCRNVSIVHALY